jgi:acetyl-CoA carboxylase alpha subunit
MAEQSELNQEPSTTAFDRVKLARHPDRPYTLDFIERLFEDFTEIHGDRRYADDPAIVCGFARFHGMPPSSWAIKRAVIPSSGSFAISECPSPKAIAKPFAQ